MENLRVVLFISRNKDNKHIEGFKERRVSFLTDKSFDELVLDFKNFIINRNHKDEISRFYISVNRRDGDKIRKGLIHYLVDHEDMNMAKIDRRIASIASLKENAKDKKWLLDFDEDPSKIDEFIADLETELPEDVKYHVTGTPNGYAITVDRGFDSRKLLAKWSMVELKRDDLLCVAWTDTDNW